MCGLTLPRVVQLSLEVELGADLMWPRTRVPSERTCEDTEVSLPELDEPERAQESTGINAASAARTRSIFMVRFPVVGRATTPASYTDLLESVTILDLRSSSGRMSLWMSSSSKRPPAAIRPDLFLRASDSEPSSSRVSPKAFHARCPKKTRISSGRGAATSFCFRIRHSVSTKT